MSITDELREYADKLSNKAAMKSEHGFSPVGMKLESIADRIDAEKEAACAEAYGNGVMSVPIALDESAWVKLPVDADGVPIRVGDVMESKDGGLLFGADSLEVRVMWLDECGWEVVDRLGDRCAPSLLRHHALTVEDVLQEFRDEVQRCCDTYDAIAEYADRIREAVEHEEDK